MFPFRLADFFSEMSRGFVKEYACYSVSMLPGNEREDVERGGKIIMPPSALEQLTRFNITYPMLFKLTNRGKSRYTHCGVLEFVADEGKVYIPYWMMRNLFLDEGELVVIESVTLNVATYSKFQPLSSDFLDISNPKAVLENSLRNFACLTKGDTIAIKYNDKIYELSVLETKPGGAVSIIECDMNVEFAPALDYKENGEPEKEDVDITKLMLPVKSFIPFSGGAARLDGRSRKKIDDSAMNVAQKQMYKRGIPDYNYKIGTLKFFRSSKPVEIQPEEEAKEDFTPFSGKGTTLKKSRRHY